MKTEKVNTKDLENRLHYLSTQTYGHISKDVDDICREFEERTKLDVKDFSFMLIVTAMHLVRQYLINEVTARKDHDVSDGPAHKAQEKLKEKAEKKHGAEFINDDFSKRYYYASRQEICNSFTVPYDIITGSKAFDLGGKDKGLSGITHRHYTLGHDPILGLYFGTANILTNTLTTTKLQTVHVADGKIVHGAQTTIMIDRFHDRIATEPLDVSFALIKQALHIWSDTYSKDGIELPFVASNLSLANAKSLMKYGVDFGNTIKSSAQFVAAEAINNLSRLILCLMYNVNKENHIIIEPKIHKIIAGANIMATSSNILQSAVTKSIDRLDFGGFLSTIKQICVSKKRISELQLEFLMQEWEKKF